MSFLQTLQSHHFDILKEIGNIGAAHAATSLSKLMNTKVEMNVPNASLVDFQDLPNIVGGADAEVAAVFFRFTGDSLGSMFFLTTVTDAEKFASKLIGQSFSFRADDEQVQMGISALSELGNILVGSYLSALSDFTGLNLQPTVPQMVVDMAGAVVHYGVLTISEVADAAILIETNIIEVDHRTNPINGQFFFIPDPESFPTLFEALGVS
ncbi:chemotaxis protein CheC [Alkalihalobacillus pseudalcaliphilus]|uniref:chemotaxis protein CheC n=1 Tax=Alkalihalobacillus pseudalcaliphilus TaxID=79884 RepID=UPI00064DC30A|nr:chemotaxis protein CheC [Alkalihalobacillus pseudalcaliphilus]KMK77234.1 chemotaxis protein CheY [Alkalihalobacillus pseudalcaliphilus]